MNNILKNKFDISVIITVYNRKKLLVRALNSVLNQSKSNFEIIIVDDGSTDGIENILLPILGEHENIIYCRINNSGTPFALNTGLKLTRSKFITFLDSDDEYERNHLEIRFRYMLRNNRTDLLYSNAKVIGNEEDYWIPDARNRNKLIHINDCIIGATFFGKKTVFEKLRGFKNQYGYDFEFFKRAKKLFKIIKLDSPTYLYYRNIKDSIINRIKQNK